MQELDDRKKKILNAIIQNYLETGEPVGSRTISKYSDLNLSSATIRNEMSDLEEMGYIIQPHTSAGRIPSDKGYRLYVDSMMEEKDREVTEMKELMIDRTEKMEEVLKQIVKILAVNTNYTTMISTPQGEHMNKLKFIQLSEVDEYQVLVVIVTEENIVKNRILPLGETIDKETLLKLNILLNTYLAGLTLGEISLAIITKLKAQAGKFSSFIGDVIDAVAEAFHEDEDLEIYTSGTTNILKYPELRDIEKASQLLTTFEEKKQLATLVNDTLGHSTSTDIQVYIGNETPVQTMKDCSVVTATYELGEGMKGTIGIIGPKRMDYENVVSNLKTLMSQMDKIFKKSEEHSQE